MKRFATPMIMLVMLLAGCASAPNQAGSKDPARFEGEPISINALGLDPKSRDYLTRVSQMIRAKWSYPCLKDETTGKCEYKPAELVIDFDVFEDGRGGRIAVAQSSGMDIYDQRAVAAVRSAAPFPRVPAELMARAKPNSGGVTIRAKLQYKLVTSTPCGDGAACD
jgi:TonB family protein